MAEAFQSLDEAWGSRTLRSQWLALPLNAVERLLSSRQLTAASENVVYIMVASWLSAQTRYIHVHKHTHTPDINASYT